MAETYVAFGGIAPAATTLTTLYTSTGGTTVVALLAACTTTKSPNAQDDSIRVYVVPSGQVAADKYLVICDMVVDATDPYVLNAPITLANGDFIQVQSANGTIAFNGSGLLTTETYETYTPFGGIKPAAATPTVLFTSPAAPATTTLEGWVQACNTTKAGAGANDLIRIWVVPNGQSTGAPLDRYLVTCDLTVDPFDPYMRTDLPVLAAGDAIVVYSLNGNVAFNGAGMEMTN